MRDPVPGWMIDRLRGNLGTAGIALSDRDLERTVELKMLSTALAFDAFDREFEVEGLPDPLGGWPGPAPTADGPAARETQPAADPDSVAGLAPRVRAREVSPVELTERALERIAAQDPGLNAFQLVLDSEARAAARAAEREIADGRHRGPLHGIPIAIKDLFDMAGTPTTAGGRMHADRVLDTDSAAVEQLRTAGAVIVGKTRLAEFAYSPGSNNAHYGPTRNPHDPSRDTGGSSSGSGAAVASGMVVAALGSDTGGSIRIPGSLCGIVGLKPTFGRVSLCGATPLAWSLDHLGPMTRTVADAAILLEALAGHDPRDPRTREAPATAWSAALDAGIRGLRIGVLDEDGEATPVRDLDAYEAWQASLRALEAAGALLEPIDLPVLADLRVVNGALLAMEAAEVHAPMMRASLTEYGEFARLRLLTAHAYGPGAYIRAQRARALLRRRFEQRWGGIDLLSMPTMPGTAPPLGQPAPTRFTAPFNLLGWPAITVPAGTHDGMPIGLQLVGRPWDEATVLRAAAAVERATAPLKAAGRTAS